MEVSMETLLLKNVTGLDDIDVKILKLLTENARMSFVDIGKEVNLSRVAVRNRIDNMEKKGIIEKYSIIVDPKKVGMTTSVFLNIITEPEQLYLVAKELKRSPFITDIYQMTGSSRLHVHAIFNSSEQLENFLKDELYSLKGVHEIECEVIISRIKTRSGIRL